MPFYDIEFCIRNGEESIGSTGNLGITKKVFNVDGRELDTTLPGMDYWKGKEFVYQLDNTYYADIQRMLSGRIESNTHEIVEKIGYSLAVPFEKKDWWYILKFFFLASEFNNLDGIGELIGGVPKELRVKCECQNLLSVEFFWMGVFRVPEQDFEHHYYLFVSRECDSCGKTICVYRPGGPLCPHLKVFMNHLIPEKNYKMTDIEMVSLWQDVFKRGAIKDMEAFQRIYTEDIVKFDTFMQAMARKYNKKGSKSS